ncbi:alpha-L-arabinofuranosidase [Mycena polygramma]|nr:alpha-L-arabinofuranosidase [Mycena polygramma]
MFQLSSLLAMCFLATTLVAARPCDIYASGGTPCVAAHSTTRALYNAYSGKLYQVKRGSDGATTDIRPLSAGGVANATAQDSFCAGTTCVISIIYDQSGRSNHFKQAPRGGNASGPEPGGFDSLAAADGAPVTLSGRKAYGVFISPASGYRNDATNGIARGDAAEGMYAVLDGTHFNGHCCFDYGNAEPSRNDTGNGRMEAIYFGNIGTTGRAKGGPWIAADLENGIFTSANRTGNPSDPTITERFVTAVVKGKPNQWAIRGGNATSGSLSTFYSGKRPSGGYNPMVKGGAIILGVGGDNSDRAQGTFYEGVMTASYPSDATEQAVQSDIVAAKYAAGSLTSGPALTVGSSVSLRATTNRYIAHNGSTVNTQIVTASNSSALKHSASWNIRAGLLRSAPGCVSFESRDTAGSFIRHKSFALFLNANDGSKQFREDATFCPRAGLNGQGNSLRSWSYPTRYFRRFHARMYAARNGGPEKYDATASFNDDVSFVVEAAFA